MLARYLEIRGDATPPDPPGYRWAILSLVLVLALVAVLLYAG